MERNDSPQVLTPNELVYTDGKLKFIRCEHGEWSDVMSSAGKAPPAWLNKFAQDAVVQLPSNPEPFESLDDLAERIRRHIHEYFDCPPQFESVAVLYVLMTWLTDLFDAVPYLRFLGIAGTGKTRGSEVIGALCYKSLGVAGAASPASLYRMIEDVGGTLVIDEADFAHSIVGSEIAKILNCGYTRGKPVVKLEKSTSEDWQPRAYRVFGPKILNGRTRFSDEATESRCLTYVSRETERTDIPTQLTPEYREEARRLRNQLLTFRFDYLKRIKFENRHIEGVSRRANQILLPLLLIAEQLKDVTFADDLKAFGHGMDAQTRQDRRETNDAVLVAAYVKLASKIAEPTCLDIKNAMVEEIGPGEPEVKALSTRSVGVLARTLGFTTPHAKRGTVLRIDGKRLAALCERFSIVTPGSPAPSSSTRADDVSDTQVTKELRA